MDNYRDIVTDFCEGGNRKHVAVLFNPFND